MNRPSWLSRNVLALGVVSLLTDTATEMVIPLLPVFLTVTLGAGAMALGWIEGLAELTASLLKLVSGRIADRSGRKRGLVVAGYALSSAFRPFIAAATTFGHVLAVRMVDRVGKGLRTSPRDALIAASVAPSERGRAFGLHRAMDHAGAVLGPLLAAGYLALWGPELRTLFWLSAIPGALAVLVLVLGTRDMVSPPGEAMSAPLRPSGDLVRVLVPVGIFSLGNATDVFLLLKANASDAPIETLPLLWMGLHIVKSASSMLGGRLADAWGRRRTIGLGWLAYAVIYAAFAFAESPLAIAGLFLVYGVYHGLTEGPERALVAEVVPQGGQGTGYGWYHLTQGVLLLVASVSFGWIWDAHGSQMAFLVAAGIAVMAVLALAALAPQRSEPKSG